MGVEKMSQQEWIVLLVLLLNNIQVIIYGKNKMNSWYNTD